MPDPVDQFAGMSPEAYHTLLGPTMFEPFALDLAARLPAAEGATILEVAAGTGVVTRALLARLPVGARLVATDLSPPMVNLGAALLGSDARLEWREADAQALRFADASFDAVVCQFGLMFFPDKPLAMREARRVLRPGGTLLLNTWDALESNAYASVTIETLAQLYPADPPRFFYGPYAYSDPAVIGSLLAGAGFVDVVVEHVDREAISESSAHFARGLVTGTPIADDLRARGTLDPEAVVARLTEQLAALGGSAPHRSPMRAVVATARVGARG